LGLDRERGHCYAWETHSWQLPSAAGCGVSTPDRADCGAASGAAKFGNVAGTAERGLVWIRRWGGVVTGAGCQFRIVASVQFPPDTRIKSLRTPNKSGLCPEVNGWLGEHKVVLDESGFWAYCVGVDLGLKFQSVKGDYVSDKVKYWLRWITATRLHKY